MKAIHMIDDYRRMCKEAEYVGKFEAYKAYTQKYHGFFNGVFKYLYCQPIENMRAMIEYADFNNLLKVAEDNYKAGMVDCALAPGRMPGSDAPPIFSTAADSPVR